MDNAIYIALSRQAALTRQLDIVSNNVANANTTGYRSERILFSQYVASVNDNIEAGLVVKQSDKLAYTQDVASATDTTQGSLVNTERTFDVAIAGQGLFAVQTPAGVLYTRAGNFQVDANGALTTAQGYPVLGKGGQQINLPQLNGAVKIGETGNISVDGEEVAQLEVLDFDNEQQLEKVGNALYRTSGPGTPADPKTYHIIQGSLEGSNVNSVAELNNMIEVSRNISGVNNIIAEVDELQLTTIRTLARQQ